jgi:P27 family predicted phage terminase small subunit
MAGRPRKPTKQKIIQGTFRKDRAPKHEPEPEPVTEAPRPPSDLPSAGKKLWKKLAPELVAKGILTVVDLSALEILCFNYGIYKELNKAIRGKIEDPVTGKIRKRTYAEYMRGENSQTIPEYTAMRNAFSTFKSYMTEFGLSPSSRAKLDVPEPKEEKDLMERLWNEN